MYIKLTGTDRGHNYIAEYYSLDGELVDQEPITLGELDKMTGTRTKMRLRTGNIWGRISVNKFGVESILVVGLPKFLREQQAS